MDNLLEEARDHLTRLRSDLLRCEEFNIDRLLKYITVEDMRLYNAYNKETATYVLYNRLLERLMDLDSGVTFIQDGTLVITENSSISELDIIPATYHACEYLGCKRLCDLSYIDYGKLPAVCAMDLAFTVADGVMYERSLLC